MSTPLLPSGPYVGTAPVNFECVITKSQSAKTRLMSTCVSGNKRLVSHLLAYSRRREWERSRFRHLMRSTIPAAHYVTPITTRSAWLAPGRCPLRQRRLMCDGLLG